MRRSSAGKRPTCARTASADQAEGRNTGGKAVVLGMLERGGKVRASVVPHRTNASIQPIVRGSVEPGTQLHSDEHDENWRMVEYEHDIVNHLEAYVDANVHTKASRISGAR